MATPNDPRFFRDGTPRDGVLRNRNPLQTPSAAPQAVTAPTQGSVALPFGDGRTPTGRTDAELASMAASQSAAADAGIARRRLDARMGRAPIAEGTLGYFVGSDGRKQVFDRASADAKAGMLPTSNTMPAGIALGDGNFAASNDARRPVGAAAPAAAVPGSTNPNDPNFSQAALDASRAAMREGVAAQRAYNESLGAPAAVAGGLARRSAVDEFNSIREGLRRPGQYDPSGATGRARGAATSVVRSNSDANRILQMAANLASDPRLKGFPGARNAIIQGLVGQIGADSDAALEGLRQTGQAGISGQEFDQSGVLQETGRRGQVLRDQFLAENEERLARINNDAALERAELSGEYQLQAAQARQRDAGSAARKEDNRRADDALRAAQEKFPDDPVAAAVRAQELTVGGGVDPEGTFAGNLNESTIRRPILDYRNDSLFGLGQLIDDWAVGRDPNQRLPEDFDFSSDNVRIDADDSFLLDLEQFFSPRWAQPYTLTTQDANGEDFSQVVRPGWFNSGPDRIPTVDDALRIQRARDTSLARRPAAPAPADEDRY